MSELMEVCPQCGYRPIHKVTIPQHIMKEYVFATNGKVYAVINNDAEDLIIPANKERETEAFSIVRKDVYEKRAIEKKALEAKAAAQKAMQVEAEKNKVSTPNPTPVSKV